MNKELKTNKIQLTSDSLGLLHSLKTKSDSVSILLDEGSPTDLFLSQVDYVGLSRFLDQFNISFSQFTTPVNTMISLNNLNVYLGDSSFINLQELYRKLDISPCCLDSISQIKFETVFDKFISEIVDFLCRGESLEHQIYAILKRNYKVYNLISPLLDSLVIDFEKATSTRYAIQILNSMSFSNNISEVERIFFVISLISPSFKLKNKLLADQLYFSLQNQKKKIYKTKHVKLEKDAITTDEKLFNFKELHLFNRIHDLDFDANSFESYSSVLLCGTPINSNSLDPFKNTRFMYINDKTIGSDTPHVEIFIDDHCKTYFTYYYKEMNGAKNSFYIEAARTKFSESIDKLTTASIEFENIEESKGPFLFKSLNNKIVNKHNSDCYFSSADKASKYLNKSMNSNLYMGKSSFIQSLLVSD